MTEYTLTAYRNYVEEVSTKLDYKGEPFYNNAEEWEVAELPNWVFGIGSEEANWAYELVDGVVTNLYIQYGWSNWGPWWEPDPYIYQQFPLRPELRYEGYGEEPDEDPEHPYTNELPGMWEQPVSDMAELVAKIGYNPNYWEAPDA